MNHYSPKQVAQRLGVSESSVKRWLDQGVVPILRTAGGHRRISEESVAKLVKRLRSTPATAESVQEAAPPREPTAEIESLAMEPDERLCTRFREALAAGCEPTCRRALHALIARGHSPASAADLAITPAMRQFGHDWERGELAIYQERRACGIAAALIQELVARYPMPESGPAAIGGTPEDDDYQLPTALIELALRERGWRAKSLGSNLPMSEFRAAVAEYQPKFVWVSLSYLADEEKFVREFNETAESLPPGVALLVGGRAASDSLRPRLKYTAHCDSLSHLLDFAQAIPV